MNWQVDFMKSYLYFIANNAYNILYFYFFIFTLIFWIIAIDIYNFGIFNVSNSLSTLNLIDYVPNCCKIYSEMPISQSNQNIFHFLIFYNYIFSALLSIIVHGVYFYSATMNKVRESSMIIINLHSPDHVMQFNKNVSITRVILSVILVILIPVLVFSSFDLYYPNFYDFFGRLFMLSAGWLFLFFMVYAIMFTKLYFVFINKSSLN